LSNSKKDAYSLRAKREQDITTNVVIIGCTNEGKRYTFFLIRYILFVCVPFCYEYRYFCCSFR